MKKQAINKALPQFLTEFGMSAYMNTTTPSKNPINREPAMSLRRLYRFACDLKSFRNWLRSSSEYSCMNFAGGQGHQEPLYGR
jgi:hypothetical protein